MKLAEFVTSYSWCALSLKKLWIVHLAVINFSDINLHQMWEFLVRPKRIQT